MNEIQSLVMKIKDSLHQTMEYRTYKELQTSIDSHPEIVIREEELKDLQKAMVAALDKKEIGLYETLKKEYEAKKEAFDNHPLVHNLRLAKEELNDLLVEIAHLIEQGLSDKSKQD